MQSSKAEQEYYSMNIMLNREFLRWVHGHRLVDGPESQYLWVNKPLTRQFRFGGRQGTQFSTTDNHCLVLL
jgi:hypothetical protein